MDATALLRAFYDELLARGQIPPHKAGYPKCLDGWGGAAEEPVEEQPTKAAE